MAQSPRLHWRLPRRALALAAAALFGAGFAVPPPPAGGPGAPGQIIGYTRSGTPVRLVAGGSGQATFTAKFTTAGTSTWTSPITGTAQTECWGGGGGGASLSASSSGGGGGGGEYAAEASNNVSAGTGYTVVRGAAGTGASAGGGAGGTGGNSTFSGGTATTVTAHGGSGGSGSGLTGGAGGTGSTNSVHHDGGAGAAGLSGTSKGGGGGGGSGGTAAAGNTGGSHTGSTAGPGATAVTGGGPGGTGGAGSGTAGSAPASGPGGGGGGNGIASIPGQTAGGNGFAGQGIVTWLMDSGVTMSAATTGGTYQFTVPAGITSVSWTITGGATFDGNNTTGSDTYTPGQVVTYTIATGGTLTITWGGSITGTGSADLPALEAAGSGVFAPVITGTGSAAVPHLLASGSGTGNLIPNTGGAALPHLQASGTGYVVPQGTGSAALKAPKASGAGAFIAKITGTGSATLPPLEASGADEGALQPFKTLLLHRPRIDAPPSLTPFVSVGDGADVPNGATEYDIPSLVSGVNARFDGTYSILLVNNTWHNPAASRTLTVTIHQHEYTGGPDYTVSIARTLTPATDITNGLVRMGNLTLPIRRLSDQNVTAFFTVTITSTDTADRFLDVLFLDTQGSTVLINSPAAYNNFFVDEPTATADLGPVMGSAFDRPAAVSVLQYADVSGEPLTVEPGDNLLLAYCVEGAPALAISYFPKFFQDALA